MAKKGNDTPLIAISAELARVEAHVSDNDAALSRLATSVEALSSQQEAAAAAIAGIQASTALAQTAHDEMKASLFKTTADMDELKDNQASKDAAQMAQATEVMVLAIKADAVTDDIKKFQASTWTALSVLSDGATAASTTMSDVHDELKKNAEALDALLAQFAAYKEEMVIDKANMVARMAKCEDDTKASDERWVEENVRMRAQVQD